MEGHTITRGELERRFQFQEVVSENAMDAHEQVRTVLVEAADALVQITGGPSREQSTVITKLEEAAFWAHAVIDRADGSIV